MAYERVVFDIFCWDSLLPEHVLPSGASANPFLQEHRKLPALFSQMWSHPPWFVEHSFISTNTRTCVMWNLKTIEDKRSFSIFICKILYQNMNVHHCPTEIHYDRNIWSWPLHSDRCDHICFSNLVSYIHWYLEKNTEMNSKPKELSEIKWIFGQNV